MDDAARRRRLEGMSRELFGRQYSAAIGAAIADTTVSVCGKDLIAALGGPPPDKGTMSKELAILKELGLLAKGREDPNDRRSLLDPDRTSSYWALCQELRQRAAERG